MAKILSRMARLLANKTPGEKLDDTPIELPLGTRKQKSVSQEIQEQIAIQIAMKQAREHGELQTIDEIKAELLDLDDDLDSDLFFSQYEYIEMADELEPFEERAPTKEGVNNANEDDSEAGQGQGHTDEDQSAG